MGQYEYRKFFIGGEWIEPHEPRELAVINPATEQPAGVISLGSARDVDLAVAAARASLPGLVTVHKAAAPGADRRLYRRLQGALQRCGRRNHGGDGRARGPVPPKRRQRWEWSLRKLRGACWITSSSRSNAAPR